MGETSRYPWEATPWFKASFCPNLLKTGDKTRRKDKKPLFETLLSPLFSAA